VNVADNTGGLRGPYLEPVVTQRFTGWNTEPGGLGTQYLPGQTFVMPAADLTLYAQWTTDPSAIGKVGPAGGLVFYENPNWGTEYWRWLEVALEDGPWGTWSSPGDFIVTTDPDLGMGKFNTEKIVRHISHTVSAAAGASSYAANGYADWFLTSSAEMYEILINIHDSGLGGFQLSSYWTSTEQDFQHAYRGSPGDGTPGSITAQMKVNGSYVRPVRAFGDGDDRETYIVVYDGNGADSGTAPTNLRHFAQGTGALTAGPGDLSRTGYIFSGWNTERDGSGTGYYSGVNLIFASSNVTLFAQWEEAVYAIGDIGPAGGFIFYIDELGAFPWTYLEAAPAITEWSGIPWGGYGIVGLASTFPGIGEGADNTNTIINALGVNAEGTAAKLCADLDINGYSDWFLPSIDELVLMNQNLHPLNGGFVDMSSYWSSSAYSYNDPSSAHVQVFGGSSTLGSKDTGNHVRAARSF
jgi:hypothetical protein